MNKIVLILGLAATLATIGALYHRHSASQDFSSEIVALKISGPVKAIYIDGKDYEWEHPASVVKRAVDGGFNLVILAFFMNQGPSDLLEAWNDSDWNERQDAINYAHSRGAKVIVSAGGSVDNPYNWISGWDYGLNVANWAVQNGLDGVDFDMENFGSPLVGGNLNAEQTIQWLADASNAARSVVGDHGLVTHAPQAPYFGQIGGGRNGWTGTTGGYTAVYWKAQSIDYFFIQYYNQGNECYNNYDSIFTWACDSFGGTSIKELSELGIPMDKLIVGKPVNWDDADDSWMSGDELRGHVQRAQNEFGWTGGVMGWEWDNPRASQWINAIYN